jgi:hypothetical protein
VVLVSAGIPPVATAAAATTTPAISRSPVSTSAAFAPVPAATPAPAAIIATTAAAKPTVIPRTRFVYAERASIDLLAVQLGDLVLRVGLRSHGHEGEAS